MFGSRRTSLTNWEKSAKAIRFYQRAADLRSSFFGVGIRPIQGKSCFLFNWNWWLSQRLDHLNGSGQHHPAIGRRKTASFPVYAASWFRVVRFTGFCWCCWSSRRLKRWAQFTRMWSRNTLGNRIRTSARIAKPIQGVTTSSYLSEQVFLLLQSIVMAVQVRDCAAVAELEDCLIPLIEPQQRELLRKLVLVTREK